MGIEETIYPLLDHLRAFPERDHFMWMSLNDAHHTLRTTQDLSVQSHINLESQDLLDEIDKTFHKTDFIGKKKERYMEELRKIDFHLGMLFQYIESHYKDDEILVSLFSDHGVKYATNDSMLLGRGATHTALMFRGANIPFGRTDELVQTMDILPTMCHFAGIEINGKIDGCLPEVFGGSRARQSVVSEVRYPNDTLKLSVKNHHYDLQLETKEKVNEFGEVDFSKYSSKLFKGSDYSFDVSLQFPEVKKQLESTIDFIKTT